MGRRDVWKYLSHQHMPANAIMVGSFCGGFVGCFTGFWRVAQSDSFDHMAFGGFQLGIVMALLRIIGCAFYYKGLKPSHAQSHLGQLCLSPGLRAIDCCFLDMELRLIR